MHIIWQFNMASRFPEKFPEAKTAEMNEEATPLNTKEIRKNWFRCFLFFGSFRLAAM